MPGNTSNNEHPTHEERQGRRRTESEPPTPSYGTTDDPASPTPHYPSAETVAPETSESRDDSVTAPTRAPTPATVDDSAEARNGSRSENNGGVPQPRRVPDEPFPARPALPETHTGMNGQRNCEEDHEGNQGSDERTGAEANDTQVGGDDGGFGDTTTTNVDAENPTPI